MIYTSQWISTGFSSSSVIYYLINKPFILASILCSVNMYEYTVQQCSMYGDQWNFVCKFRSHLSFTRDRFVYFRFNFHEISQIKYTWHFGTSLVRYPSNVIDRNIYHIIIVTGLPLSSSGIVPWHWAIFTRASVSM
jgi:hypothetical protein